MIGSLILQRCLENDQVTSVRSFARKPTGIKHPKVREIVIEDFENLQGLEGYFTDVSA